MLKNPIIYEPPFSEINEKRILELLRDVKEDLRQINFKFSDMGLSKILSLVDSGQVDFSGENVTWEYRVDLSKAQCLVEEYRRFSGESCEHFRFHQTLPDERARYCGRDEAADVVSSGGDSLKIATYLSEGCDDRKPRFRPIETVLAETESS